MKAFGGVPPPCVSKSARRGIDDDVGQIGLEPMTGGHRDQALTPHREEPTLALTKWLRPALTSGLTPREKAPAMFVEAHLTK
jgi:hypothetical protein